AERRKSAVSTGQQRDVRRDALCGSAANLCAGSVPVPFLRRSCLRCYSEVRMHPSKTQSKVQVLEENNASSGGYKVFNRIVDWITSDRMQLLNITDRINEIVRKSGIRDGLVHLQSLHTTSGVFLNEWQDALIHDVKQFFDQVVDREQYYRHNDPQFS